MEAKLRKIELDEEKGEVIEAYVYWLYYGKVAEPRKLDPEAPDVLDRTTVALTQGQLIDIWLFGDRRGIPALQNHALIMFAQHMNETTKVDRNLIPIVYDNTTKTAPRRRLFVTKAAVFWDWGAVPKSDTVIPPAFMMDACVRLGQIRGDLAMGFRPLPLTDSTPIENYLLGEKL